MNAEETSVIHQSENAKDKLDTLIQLKLNIAANYLAVAKLLYEFHRDSLYKFVGCDSFNEFLGMPELGFKKSKAYDLISIWGLFKERMNVDDHTLLDIDRTKLRKLLPIAGEVEKDPEEWLAKARSLSVSDLAIEIAGVSGKLSPPFSPPSSPAPLAPPQPRMHPDKYINIVKHSPCICCGRTDTIVQAHFPRTRVRAEQPWHVIPLCPACHAEQEGSSEWCWKYRGNWARWFYGLIAGE